MDEPGFSDGPTMLPPHSMGSSPSMSIGHTGPQLGGVGLSFGDESTPYAPRGKRRKSRQSGSSVFLFVFIFLLLVGGGVGGAYFAGFIKLPGATPPTPPPKIRTVADSGMRGLPAIPRPTTPDAGTKAPSKRLTKAVKPRVRRPKPRVRRPKPRVRRPRPRVRRPRPRPRCRYGKLMIDTKRKRARVNITGTGYINLPLLSPRRMRAGSHKFGFLWPGGFKNKRLRVIGCRTTKYFCILDNSKVRCEKD